MESHGLEATATMPTHATLKERASVPQAKTVPAGSHDTFDGSYTAKISELLHILLLFCLHKYEARCNLNHIQSAPTHRNSS